MKTNPKVWAFVLGLWFILWGLLSISNFRITGSDVVLGLVALIGGILLIADR